MSGHGGSRRGAGAPPRGVSEAKRLLVRALEKGLEIAGREKGLTGSADEVATEAAAQIAADMVRGGRGDEVLKLLAIAAPARDPSSAPGQRSALADALSRLPGMESDDSEAIGGPAASQDGEGGAESDDESAACERRASDRRSDGRAREPLTLTPQGDVDQAPRMFWPGQPMLQLDDDAPVFVAGSRGAYGPGRQAGAGATTPRTPPGGYPAGYPVGTENFEKTGEAT